MSSSNISVSLIESANSLSLNSLSTPFSISMQSHGFIKCGKGQRTLEVEPLESPGVRDSDDDIFEGDDDNVDKVEDKGDLLLVEPVETIKSKQIKVNNSFTIIIINILVGEVDDIFIFTVVMDG